MVGFSALEQDLQLGSVQPLWSTTRIGGSPGIVFKDGFRVETKTTAYRPENTIRGHFEFGLKYDDLNLEWLFRLFLRTGGSWIEDWIVDSPRSVFARKAGFLYEWMTGESLEHTSGPAAYVNVLDPGKYLTATAPTKNTRWKLLDNMPGTPDYCPMVRLTSEVSHEVQFDVVKALSELDEKFGADLLMRSAAWLTFNESRATFTMEKESDRPSDIKRFAVAMAEHCGRIEEPLSDDSLKILQKAVLGARALRTGIRKSPVFVGTGAHFDVTVVRYIAPGFESVGRLLNGLRDFEERTRPSELDQRKSLIRAAAVAYGFVYIHPLSDGNGRVHRLLINDVLLRDGLVPGGVILPVSSTIVKSSTLRGEYDKVLDSISARQVKRYVTDYSFGPEYVCEDGVVSNFVFKAEKDAAPMWRFPDLTQHTLFMAKIVRKTVLENMTDEAEILARHDEARRRLKQAFEMPDNDADRIIRSLRQNGGKVTNTLSEEYVAIFDDPEVAAEVIEAVTSALDGRPQENVAPAKTQADRMG